MSDSFLSPSWYRVAALRPALASHVQVHRHRYRDGAWYVLEDALTGRVHRLSPTAYAAAGRFDGTRTVDEVWLEMARLLGDHAMAQDEVIGLLGQLHGADLLAVDSVPDVRALAERRDKQSKALHRQNLLNPTSFRIPLFDPDRLLGAIARRIGFLIGPIGLVLWIAWTSPAIILAVQHWRALTENLSDRVLSTGSLLTLLLVYPVVKLLHEIGHGAVAKRYGAPVPEFGALLLVFLPMPYVDVSASAAFASRWRRAAVAAAGVLVESALAAGALYLWLASEPGLVRALCFDVILIGSVSTIVANGNPLLRFDGYYVLCDLLDVPNLGSRANRYLRHLVDTKLFGLDRRKFVATAAERCLFLIYAPLAFVYRILLLASIAALVTAQYFVLGAILALWMAAQALVLPLAKAAWALVAGQAYRRKRLRVLSLTGGALAAAAIGLFALPAPTWTAGTGIVWLPETAQVRAGTSGFLAAYAAAPDSMVQPGDRLVELEDPALQSRIEALTWRVRELSLKLGTHIVRDRVLAELTRIELVRAQDELAREQDRRVRMVASSEIAGRFETAHPAGDGPGRFFKEGDLIGYVLPDRASEVRTVVLQDEIDRVRGSDRGLELMPLDTSGRPLRSMILRAVPAGLFDLPSPALGTAAGGPVPSDPRDRDGRKALARVFQYDVAFATEEQPAKFGGRVAIKFRHDPEPVGVQLYRSFRQLFLARFGA